MTYEQALQYIENTYLFGAKPGLQRMKKLANHLNNPQNALKFIHVAGTNGKGSTSTAIASVLKQAGYKTGLFRSPYITDFCERIKINDKKISHEDLIYQVENIIPIIDKLKKENIIPTEFEIITAIALQYFKDMKCDVVVLEVGLGGSFDATNIIDSPLVSVITSISYDHTHILGNTLTEIATEKSGIIKRNIPTVTSPNQNIEALEVIMKNCAHQNSNLIIPNINAVGIASESIYGTDINYDNLNIHIPLTGRHQIENFITAYKAITVVKQSDFTITNQDIITGFSNVKFEARMEILNKAPLVVIDGAHNPSGILTLKDSITRYLKEKPIIIMGMLEDKNYEDSIKTIAQLGRSFIAVTPKSPRALSSKKAKEIAEKYCDKCYNIEDYGEAFKFAISENKNTPIIICGSLYLAGEMRKTVNEYFKNNN